MIPSRCFGIDARYFERLRLPKRTPSVNSSRSFGAALADNLRDDRDCDFLGRLAADREAERRVNVGEALLGNPALADSLERGLHPAARTDHPDESARLHQRRAHDFLVERMTARDGHQVAVAVERERIDRALKGLTIISSASGNRSRLANDARSSITVT